MAKSKARRPRIEVREIATRALVREIALTHTSPRYVERVLSGLLRQMDTERFYAAEVDT